MRHRNGEGYRMGPVGATSPLSRLRERVASEGLSRLRERVASEGEPGEGSCNCGTPLPPRIRSGPSPSFAGRGDKIATASEGALERNATALRYARSLN